MDKYIVRRARSILPMLVIFFVSLLIPSLSTVRSAEAAPTPTYTWTSQSPGTIDRNDNTIFTQVTKDDLGNTLVLPSDEMILESSPDSNSCLSGTTTVSDPNDPLSLLTTTNQNSPDAEFGNGELLIVRPYFSATTATLVTWPHIDCNPDALKGPLRPLMTTVNLDNTYNTSAVQAVQWTSDSPVPVMSYLGSAFTETNVDNGTMTLTGRSIPNINLCSAPTLSVGDTTNSFLTATSATLTLDILVPNRGIGSCKTSTQTVPLVNEYITAESTANWVDGSNTDPGAQIQISNVGSGDLGIINNGDIYVEPQTGQLAITGNTMTLNGGINTAGKCINNINEDQIQVNPYQTAEIATVTVYHAGTHACIPVKITVGLTNLYGGTSPTPTGGNPVGANDPCNVAISNEPLRWIECPVMSTLEFATSAVNGFISSLLEISPSEFFNSNTQQAFNIFRDMGVALLVIAGLVMVVSQAADLEIFSAHTVRKALPRIIIAAILISLSWPLLQFVIGFFNDMGAWTGKIILSVADAMPAGSNDVGSVFANVGDTLIVSLVSVGAIVFLSAAGIISLLVSVLLLLFVGAFVLMAIQVVILICVLFTPLALASYVLPGTEKIGRSWKDTFVTALVTFPLIKGFLAGGTALAYIIMSVKSGNYFYHILALVVFIAPYVMIPLTFRIAGGLVGRIADFAQGTHRQTIESKLQAQRQGIVAKNWNAFRAGSRYNPNSSWTRFTGGSAVNFLGRHVGAGPRGRFGFGITSKQRALGKAAMANNMALSADAASKMDSNFAAQMNSEDAMAAVAFGNNRATLQRLTVFKNDTARLDKAIAAGRTIQATQQMQVAAADALARSGKVLDNRQELERLMDSTSHGNGALRSTLMGQYEFTSRQVGRADLGHDTAYKALKELTASDVARQKPASLENLFGPGKPLVTGGPVGPAPIEQAIKEASNKGNKEEAQHFADILFASQFSPYSSPQLQQSIGNASKMFIEPGQPGHDSVQYNPALAGYWKKAQANYGSKYPTGGGGGGPNPSDRRLKTDIVHLYTRPDGIKLYHFRYRWGSSRYIGVMAQDLLHSHPEAVSIDLDGYYRVDYALLGIQMLELD